MRFRKRAVPKTGFYGTELTLGAQNSLLVYGRRFQRHSVQKTGFSCTEWKFGAKKGLLVYATRFQMCAKQPPAPPNAFSKAQKTASCHTERIFKGPQNSRLHRLWTASCRTGRIFSARNGHRSLCSLRRPLPLLLRRHSVPETALRSEVSKYKKRMTSKSIKTFGHPFFYNNQSADYQKLNFSMACTR